MEVHKAMITYPVRAVGGRSHQLEDAAGRVIGSVEAADLINAGEAQELRRQLAAALDHRSLGEPVWNDGQGMPNGCNNEAVRKALNAVWAKHNLLHGWTALDEPGIIPDIITAVRGAP